MSGPAIRTEDLTRHFKTVEAVDGLTLDVRRGEIFGFLGPNGAGKTTTLHLLLGILRPTRGNAWVLDHDVRVDPRGVRKDVGALLEHNGLYERFNAVENLAFFGRIYGMSSTERNERTRELLEPLGLWERRKETVGKWSRGMKQKLAIARALFHRPQLVFLDEPTAGHDPVAAAQLRDDLVSLSKNQGVTVFLTTHNLHEAERVCDRVALVRKGKLLAVNRPDELRPPAVPRLEILLHGAPPRALNVARKVPGVAFAALNGSVLTVDLVDAAAAPQVVKALVGFGIEVEEVRRVKPTLEQAFLDLVQEAKT